MRAFFRLLIPALALVSLVSLVPAAAAGDPAVQQITSFYATLSDTMKQGAALGIQGRYKKLQPAIEAVYDLQTATAYSAGPSWATLSDADKKALVAAFERFTIASYAKNFASYSGEQFPVSPAPIVRGADKIVESKIVPASGAPIPMNYRMRLSNGTWKIVDVYLDGSISQLATHRSDYSATIASEGAAGLTKKLNALSDKLMAQ
jgi:phospholipid transport system substrate-binding protein